MAKTTIKYWNGNAVELTVGSEQGTGEYTRLTRFLPAADATPHRQVRL
jgi:hypothetical protein